MLCIEREIAANAELDAVLVVRAEEVFALGGVLRRFRRVHRDPSNSLRVELGPAMIAADLTRSSVGGKWKTDRETSGDSERSTVSDDNRVKVRAVAATRVARVVDIASSPALTGFVVLHGCDDVIVDRARFFEISFRASSIYHFFGPLFDLTVDRHKSIRLKPT